MAGGARLKIGTVWVRIPPWVLGKNMKKINIHRQMVTETFRDFCKDNDIVCQYVSDKENIEDGHIMTLFGAMQKAWALASEKKYSQK